MLSTPPVRVLQLAGTQPVQGRQDPHQLHEPAKLHPGESAANGFTHLAHLEPLKRGNQQAAAANGDIPAVVTPERVGGEGAARGSRAGDPKAMTQGAARAGSGSTGESSSTAYRCCAVPT